VSPKAVLVTQVSSVWVHQDIITLNERVVASDAELPENIRYATYYNRDRDAINAALFEEHCAQMFTKHGHTNDAIMVFSDKLKI